MVNANEQTCILFKISFYQKKKIVKFQELNRNDDHHLVVEN